MSLQNAEENHNPNLDLLARLSNKHNEIFNQLVNLSKDSSFIKIDNYKPKQIQLYEILNQDRQACKSVMKMPFTCDKIMQFLTHTHNRMRINNNTATMDQEIISGNIFIEKHIYDFPWPLFSRSFVLCFWKKQAQDSENMLAWQSCDYSCLVQEDKFKGQCKIGGFIIEKINQNESKVSFVVQAKLGFGAQMLIRNFLHDQARSLQKLYLFLSQNLSNNIYNQ